MNDRRWTRWLTCLIGFAFFLVACGGDTGEAVGEAQEGQAPQADTSAAGAETNADQTLDPDAAEEDPSSEPAPAPTSAPSAPTAVAVVEEIQPVVYADDFGSSIAPIFAEHCASCHNAGGSGAAHWRLETAADLVGTHEWIAQVVASEYMPPWPASEMSVVFQGDRSLRDDEIAAILAWSAAGAVLDVDEAMPIEAPEAEVLFPVWYPVRPEAPFQGSPDIVDDYRCLVYDPELTEAQWLTGFSFEPDQTEIVHHAVGYIAQASAADAARERAAEDELEGWQCYGSAGLRGADELFLGWAPGQQATKFPDGSGILMNPGDFIVLQIHYHYDSGEAPPDLSALNLAWSNAPSLAQIDTAQFLGPAEIPCASDEQGPLCDRDAAMERALEAYGPDGVLADSINQFCGVTPETFASMTNGVASSSCSLPVRDPGTIVSVFGHMHEIGQSIRLTLNPGRNDERVLLDIPDWNFDWQFNYYPVEEISVGIGDVVLIECSWDRSRRDPALEPAYVLWADGTNDEMCYAQIATVRDPMSPAQADTDALPDVTSFDISVPPELAACLAETGHSLDGTPERNEIDATVNRLFECEEPEEIGRQLGEVLSENFSGFIGPEGVVCLSEAFQLPDNVRHLLMFSIEGASSEDRTPLAELTSECISLYDAIVTFGLPIPEQARDCIDNAGREVIFDVVLEGALPDDQQLLGSLTPCLGS